MKRPPLHLGLIPEFLRTEFPDLPAAVAEEVSISVKYEGYILKQQQQIEQFKKMESRMIPEDIHYEEISGLRIEARQKLARHKPRSLGQASRISGVSPADISVLVIYLNASSRRKEE